MSQTTIMLARRAAEREAKAQAVAPSLPAPAQPRVAIDPLHPSVPSSPKRIYKKAVAQGWRARLTHAVGPWLGANGEIHDEAVHSLALAVQSPDGRRRLVFKWRYQNGSWKSVEAQEFTHPWRVLGIKEAEGRLT